MAGPAFQDSQGLGDLRNGFFGTFQGAASAAVAQLGKNQGFPSQYHDGVEFADLGAAAATGTQGLIHLWDEHIHVHTLVDGRFKENMGVRGLDIAIPERNRLAVICQGSSETGGNGGFAGAAFPAGNRDDHN